MTAGELRKRYIEFFKERGHAEVPSASLVPENDPTVLFTTAGMHPLVPYLLGEAHPEGRRLVDVQKCVRTGDIDEVGDDTHLTFFEMLGNWSLQDYFKKEAITWSFEFFTQELGFSLDRIAVSVFEGEGEIPRDEESAGIWRELGIADARIQYLGRKDNWWGPAGQTGPCGPDTEMFYYVGDGPAPEHFDPSDERWVEFWNDVFMEYNKTADGTYEPLAKPNVDTGMGLERALAIVNGKSNVFETSLFTPIIKEIELLTSAVYSEQMKAMRIIADHVRTAVMMVSDGVVPSNKDQGYILRRLIRRAVRQLLQLGYEGSLEPIVEVAIETLMDEYKELEERQKEIVGAVNAETQKFQKTLKKGLKEFEKMFASGAISGEQAFILYSTYGFPLELTEELVREKGLDVDRAVFEKEFKAHQDLSRAGAEQKFAGGLADHSEESQKLHTATHLLHQALRTVLGDHVFQKGSNITQERLRFDFSHDQKMTSEQKQEVERIVNEQIEKNLPMSFEMMTVEEAKAIGAIGLFEDTYAQKGNKIKVYTAGSEEQGVFSREICGGPHVDATGALGAFAIKKEEASSAGVRRIKAVVGEKATTLLQARSK